MRIGPGESQGQRRLIHRALRLGWGLERCDSTAKTGCTKLLPFWLFFLFLALTHALAFDLHRGLAAFVVSPPGALNMLCSTGVQFLRLCRRNWIIKHKLVFIIARCAYRHVSPEC